MLKHIKPSKPEAAQRMASQPQEWLYSPPNININSFAEVLPCGKNFVHRVPAGRTPMLDEMSGPWRVRPWHHQRLAWIWSCCVALGSKTHRCHVPWCTPVAISIHMVFPTIFGKQWKTHIYTLKAGVRRATSFYLHSLVLWFALWNSAIGRASRSTITDISRQLPHNPAHQTGYSNAM